MAFVLIMDESKILAERASNVLIGAGHACGWVASAEQATGLLRWRTPDILLLDQAMPGARDGTLPDRLRHIARIPNLPIILLTTEAGAKPCDGSIVDHIQKPFDPRYLVWLVNHALEAHAGRPLVFGEGSEDTPAACGKFRSRHSLA